MPRTYTNAEHPPQGVPPKNMDKVQVFVRLVDSELGERYLPGTAMRWTSTHVMIAFIDSADPNFPTSITTAWLRAEDVWRVATRPRSTARSQPRTGTPQRRSR